MVRMDKRLSDYLACALWSSGEEYDDYGVFDFAPSALERAEKDLTDFWDKILPHFDKYENWNDEPSDRDTAHDFWLTRCGHGTGFWDNPGIYGVENGEIFTQIAKEFGEAWLYIGDDDLVYFY